METEPGLLRTLERAQERLARHYGSGSWETGIYGTSYSVSDAAANIEEIPPAVDSPELVDLGSGVGSYPLIAAARGIESAGIEIDEETYRESLRALEELESKGLLNAEAELVNGDFYGDAWEEIGRRLEEFNVVVANHHTSEQAEVMEHLREEGPREAVYIFPGVEDPEGFEPLNGKADLFRPY